MLKGFVNALFPNVHTQSNYDFKAKEAKQLGGKLSQSSIKKPDNKYSEMGIGERTNKGKPVPGETLRVVVSQTLTRYRSRISAQHGDWRAW